MKNLFMELATFVAASRRDFLGMDEAVKETSTNTHQEARRLMHETIEQLSPPESMLLSSAESMQLSSNRRPLTSGTNPGSPCPICYTRPPNTDPFTCDHKFCEECVTKWRQQATGNGKCPMCRSLLKRSKAKKLWDYLCSLVRLFVLLFQIFALIRPLLAYIVFLLYSKSLFSFFSRFVFRSLRAAS